MYQKIRYGDNSVVGRKKTTGFQDLWAVVFLCNTYLQDDLLKMHPCAYSSTRRNLAGMQLWPGKQKEKVLTVGKLMRQLQWRRELAWTTCTCMDIMCTLMDLTCTWVRGIVDLKAQGKF